MSTLSLPSLHADSATLLAELREMGIDDTVIDNHEIFSRLYVLGLRDGQTILGTSAVGHTEPGGGL